ncbi:MAG: hypothetical protein JXA25_07470 [Anaerolineales bacterium]|nr:hypothetical protein [Anaerolineales bacterium]
MIVMWMLAGAAAGLWISFSQRKTVRKVKPGANARLQRSVVRGALLRWLLAGAVMAAGFYSSLQAGIAVFAALWIARWIVLFRHRLWTGEVTTEESRVGRS